MTKFEKRVRSLEDGHPQDKGAMMANYLCKCWLGEDPTNAEKKLYSDVQAGKVPFSMSDFSKDFADWVSPRCGVVDAAA